MKYSVIPLQFGYPKYPSEQLSQFSPEYSGEHLSHFSPSKPISQVHLPVESHSEEETPSALQPHSKNYD